jgi:ABC-type uncharacterized transport system ATPase subunit
LSKSPQVPDESGIFHLFFKRSLRIGVGIFVATPDRRMDLMATPSRRSKFGALTAVDAMTISIEQGEVFGLLGANGDGKTTAIKMLTTLLRPTSSKAYVAGLRHH